MYRIGLIGCGIIAASHAAAISAVPEAELVAAADTNEARALSYASNYGIKPYMDYRAMMEEQRPDIVIVNLPHYLHKAAVLEAARRHIHVLLEKPMAMNDAECQEMAAAADAGGIKLFIGHIQRYMDFNIRVRELIRSGELGELVCISEKLYTDYFNDIRPGWFLQRDKAGGGIVFNLGAHFFDRIQWVTGERAVNITGRVDHKKTDYDVEGAAHIFCRLDSGITAACILNGYSSVEQHSIEYVFTDGMVEIQPFCRMVICEKTGSRTIAIGEDNMFTRQLGDFIDCIKNNAAPQIPGDYGRHIINCIHSVYESSCKMKTIFVDKNEILY